MVPITVAPQLLSQAALRLQEARQDWDASPWGGSGGQQEELKLAWSKAESQLAELKGLMQGALNPVTVAQPVISTLHL